MIILFNLEERVVTYLHKKGIYHNPTYSDLQDLKKEIKEVGIENEARFAIQRHEGRKPDVYVWEAATNLHNEIANEITDLGQGFGSSYYKVPGVIWGTAIFEGNSLSALNIHGNVENTEYDDYKNPYVKVSEQVFDYIKNH